MIRAFFAFLALLIAIPAAAHQQKAAITTVEHNPRTGMIEVVHRVPHHDAEHALRQQGMATPDIVNDIESRRAFARYAAARFSIEAEGMPLELRLLGTEIEGGNLLIFQEGASPQTGAEIIVHSQVLTDVWARQVNRVNIGSGTSPETLVFRSGDGPKSAILR